MTPSRHRTVGVLYAVAAVSLVPWIIVLATTQRRTVVAHRLTYVVPISVAGVVIGMAWTAYVIRNRQEFIVVAATFTATSALALSWFHVVTGTAAIGTTELLLPVVLLVAIAATTIGMANGSSSRRESRRTRRFQDALYVSLAVAICVVAAGLTRVTPSVHVASHMRLVWTGLDICELLSLALTAYALIVDTRIIPAAAMTTATLLLWDAWFNVAPTAGATQSGAAVMAMIEVPLALITAGIAIRGLDVALIRSGVERPAKAKVDRLRSASNLKRPHQSAATDHRSQQP